MSVESCTEGVEGSPIMALNLCLTPMFWQGLWWDECVTEEDYQKYYSPRTAHLIVNNKFIRVALKLQRTIQPIFMITTLLIYSIVIFPMGMYTFWGNPTDVANNFFGVITASLLLVCYLTPCFRQQEIKDIVSKIRPYLDLQILENEKQGQMLKRFDAVCSRFTIFSHIICSCIFAPIVLLLAAFALLPNRLFYIREWYPWDSASSPMYEITLFIRSISYATGLITCSTIASILFTAFFFMYTEFKILFNKIDNIKTIAVNMKLARQPHLKYGRSTKFQRERNERTRIGLPNNNIRRLIEICEPNTFRVTDGIEDFLEGILIHQETSPNTENRNTRSSTRACHRSEVVPTNNNIRRMTEICESKSCRVTDGIEDFLEGILIHQETSPNTANRNTRSSARACHRPEVVSTSLEASRVMALEELHPTRRDDGCLIQFTSVQKITREPSTGHNGSDSRRITVKTITENASSLNSVRNRSDSFSNGSLTNRRKHLMKLPLKYILEVSSVLNEIVDTYSVLLRLFQDVSYICNVFFIGIFLVNTVVVAIVLILIQIGIVDKFVLVLVSVICAGITQSYFFLNYFGDQLSLMSSAVGEALYNTDWTGASQSFKKSMLIVMTRANVTSEFKPTGLDPLSLRNFAEVSKIAYKMISTIRWFVK